MTVFRELAHLHNGFAASLITVPGFSMGKQRLVLDQHFRTLTPTGANGTGEWRSRENGGEKWGRQSR